MNVAIVRTGFLDVQVCTSLGDEDATTWLNEVHPTGISSPWSIDWKRPPVACADKPDTHRHLLYLC